MSKFEVKTEAMAEQVKQAFVDRPHMVETATGFMRLDVISPCENRKEIWLITYWNERADYTIWHKSHSYRDSHSGMPKGLKLNAAVTSVSFFEHVSS